MIWSSVWDKSILTESELSSTSDWICDTGNVKLNWFSKRKYCSDECRKKSSNEKISLLIKEKVINGTHKGWKTRNIISYPEKFWMKVLNNNSISFHKEYHIDNKYFLDFFIEKNEFKIDLEIDGKQHLYEDRKLHDIERDKYLTEKGYIVYRIPWNEINSEQGKEKMKQKIEEFLTFFNNLKNWYKKYFKYKIRYKDFEKVGCQEKSYLSTLTVKCKWKSYIHM